MDPVSLVASPAAVVAAEVAAAGNAHRLLH